jgi:peptidoglycan/LPS O-acetylase OafA/YrhL
MGISDAVARGLYAGLTIRQIADQEGVLCSARGGAVAPRRVRMPLARVETSVFIRAFAICVVVASHVGLPDLTGNPSLMIVSGFSFGKFQLRAIEKEQSIKPVVGFMLRLIVPTLLYTIVHQFALGDVNVKSWLLIDNWWDPLPFKANETPYFIDLLLQNMLIAAVPL